MDHETRHLRRTPPRRIGRAEVGETDAVSVPLGHANRPMLELRAGPLKVVARMTFAPGLHAMQHVVFLVHTKWKVTGAARCHQPGELMATARQARSGAFVTRDL